MRCRQSLFAGSVDAAEVGKQCRPVYPRKAWRGRNEYIKSDVDSHGFCGRVL